MRQSRGLGPRRTLKIPLPQDMAERLVRESRRNNESVSLTVYKALRRVFPDPFSDLCGAEATVSLKGGAIQVTGEVPIKLLTSSLYGNMSNPDGNPPPL